MTDKVDMSAAAIELATCICEVLAPPVSGAPTEAMKDAFQAGWLRPFDKRFAALVEASWPKLHPETLRTLPPP